MSKGKKETELTADELAALAVAEEKAAATRIAAARSAADAAAEEEYKAAAADAVEAQAVESFSHKRGTEQIFRREMGEPESPHKGWTHNAAKEKNQTDLIKKEERKRGEKMNELSWREKGF